MFQILNQLLLKKSFIDLTGSKNKEKNSPINNCFFSKSYNA